MEPVVCVVLFFHLFFHLGPAGTLSPAGPFSVRWSISFWLASLVLFVFFLVVVVSVCFRIGWFWWGLPLLNCLEASGTLSECLFFFGIHSLQLKLQKFPQCRV